MSRGNLDLHIQPPVLTAAWLKLEETEVAHFLPADPYPFHICRLYLLPMPFARPKPQDTHRDTHYISTHVPYCLKSKDTLWRVTQTSLFELAEWSKKPTYVTV